MDSTSIACAAALLVSEGRAGEKKLQTFSSVFNNFPEVDERRYIQSVLDAWELDGTFIYADELWGFKPVESPGILWNRPYPVPFKARHEALLARAHDSGVRVMLTGEGGDELLNAGFEHFLDMLRGLQLGQLFRELRNLTPQARRQFYRRAFWHFIPRLVKQGYSRLRAEDDLAWLSEDFIRQSGAREHETLRLPRGRPRSLYALGLYQGLASLGQLPYLSYASEMYAYHHIEARHPFLDMRVMDFLARVPPRLKFARGWSKYLLRKAMEGVLPDAVRLRALKSAFTDVRDYGIRREKEQIAALIEQGHLVRRGWVIKQGIEALYERMLAGDKRWAGRITAFLTLEEWLSDCFGSNSGRTPTGFHHSPALRVERRCV
jgi:asparagine synthase (glutamine-hydrolysing)